MRYKHRAVLFAASCGAGFPKFFCCTKYVVYEYVTTGPQTVARSSSGQALWLAHFAWSNLCSFYMAFWNCLDIPVIFLVCGPFILRSLHLLSLLRWRVSGAYRHSDPQSDPHIGPQRSTATRQQSTRRSKAIHIAIHSHSTAIHTAIHMRSSNI